VLRSIGRFLWLAVAPLSRFSGGLQVSVGLPISGLGVFLFGWRYGVWWGVVSSLALVAGLFGIAGVRLQRDKERRETARFDFSAGSEVLDRGVELNNRTFEGEVRLWVSVRNDGPTSTFADRVTRVAGTPSSWGEDYRVLHPAWEHSAASEIRIPGQGGERRLALASVMLSPRAFWFYTSQSGAHAAGSQFLIDDLYSRDAVVEIEFDLEVINTGAADQTRMKRGHLTIPPSDTGLPAVILADGRD
jgi:hypothetical protein